MAEAIEQVKRKLGRHAVILHTRTFTRGGVLGFGGRSMVEITAARQLSDLPLSARPGKLVAKSGEEATEVNGARTPVVAVAAAATPPPSALDAEVRALKSLVTELVVESRRSRTPGMPSELLETYTHLVEAQVAEGLARELVERVRAELGERGLGTPSLIRERLAAYVESMLPVGGPIRLPAKTVSGQAVEPTVIALVGPTGVGKTTTVAKLAANFSLREQRRVGLITIDTYRIAAVDQLRTYAQIIDVPLEVVMTPSQMQGALERMRDRDVVLIDTAGRGQNDALRISELKCYLEQARPHEVHLVLSTTSSEVVMQQAIERFGEVGVDRLILTKLDEAIGFGVVLSCLAKARLGLSYVTTGQDVPDDIEVGRSKRLAELIVNGREQAVSRQPLALGQRRAAGS